MTAQLKWPSTNQNTAWRTFLVVGDMRERVSHAGMESRIIANGAVRTTILRREKRQIENQPLFHAPLTLGMKPGTPVFTTGFSRCLV
jgi:hypothetical protein